MFGAASGSGFGGFGQQNNQQQGQQPGQTGGGGLFGAAQPSTTGATGGFGAAQPPNTAGAAGGFGGFGAQQQQQPQQTGFGASTGGLFGQPAAPASGGFGFGQTNNAAPAFGQQAQANQPKPAGFGGFGASTSGTTTGFGGFGAQPNQTPAFGTPSAGNNAFGAKPAGSSLFGQQQQQSQPQSGAFGQPAAPSGGLFGGGGGLSAQQTGGLPTQGTANPPYQAFINTEKDANGNGTTTNRYTSISCMPAYEKASLEELRVQDYQQGRKSGTAGPAAGGFGQPANAGGAFGAAPSTGGGLFGQAQPQQSTGFGGGGLFGASNNTQQQPQQSGGLFGSSSTTGTGLFGQPAQQQQQQQPQQGGLFGQQGNQAQGSSGFSFGQTPQQPQAGAASSGFTFGQAAQPKPAGGLFGSNTGGGGFGANTSQPASGGFSFGGATSQAPQTGGFGAPATSTGGFGFGAQANANQPKPGGLFGASTSAAPAFGGFGASSTAATDANKPAFSFGGGGGFGTSAAPGQTTTAAPTGGLFGNQQSAPSTQGGGFSFGGGANNTTNTGAAGGGGFSFGGLGGQQQGQQQQNATGGFGAGGSSLFGQNKPATGGLFGQPAQQQQTSNTGGFSFGAPANNTTGAQTGGGLFGSNANKPAAGGLFGGSLGGTQAGQAGGGLFGANNSAGQQTGGGGLFGGGQAGGQGTGLFGSTQNNTTGGGGLFGGGGGNNTFGASAAGFGATGGQQGSLFGQSGTQQAPNLQASLNANPYGTDALFGSSATATSNTGFGANTSIPQQTMLPFNVSRPSAKKPPVVPPYRPNPRNTARITMLRGSTPNGFREGSPAGRDGSPFLFGSSLDSSRISSPSTAASRSLFQGLSDELPAPQRFTPQRDGSVPPALPSQAFVSRPSVKRLVLDDQGSRSSMLGGTPSRSQSLFGTRAGSTLPDDSIANGGRARGGTPSLFDRSTPLAMADNRINYNPARAATTDAGDESSFTSSVLGGLTAAARHNGRSSAAAFADTPSKAGGDLHVPSMSTPKKKEDALLPLDYYTSPPLSELREWSHAELRSVEAFIVGRKGFGSVEFVQPVDLTTVGELSNVPGGIVQLRKKECYVYPEEDDCFDPETGNERDGVQPGFDPKSVPGGKAKRGQGLNVPAIVHLEGCWPLDRSTRQPIKDAEHPRTKQMVNKLKRRGDMKFKGYDATRGVWSFRVEHFSRYGLDDDDDDDEEPTVSKEKQKGAAAAANTKASTKDKADDDMDDAPPRRALDDDDDDDDDNNNNNNELGKDDVHAAARHRRSPSRTATSRATPQPVEAPWAATLGLEARRLQVMQASFFSGADSSSGRSAPAAAGQKPVYAKKSRMASPSPVATVAARSNFATPIAPALTMREASTDDGVAAPASAAATAPRKGLDISLAPPVRPRKMTKIELDSSVTDDGHGVVLDAGLAMGRSFRVGWGPDGTFVHRSAVTKASSGSDTEVTSSDSLSTVKMSKMQMIKRDQRSHEMETILKLLKVQLDNSIIRAQGEDEDDGVADEDEEDEEEDGMEGEKCPIVIPNAALRFKHFVTAMSQEKDRHYELAIFRLASALFDEIDMKLKANTPRDIAAQAMQLRRKNNVANWIRWYVDEIVRNEVRSQHASPKRNSGERIIFSYLTGGYFEEACRHALDMGNVRLATLLAQANGGGSDEEFRLDLFEQLGVWRAGGVDNLISPEYRRIVELLSGNVFISMGNSKRDESERLDDLAIGAGLDWLRTFALYLHFDQRFEASVADSVAAYEDSIGHGAGDGDHYIVPPLPPYLERDVRPGSKRFRDLIRSRTYRPDVLFGLLKLFSRADFALESVLDPQQYGESACNYGVAFHLAQLLSPRVLGVRDFDDRQDLGIEAATRSSGNSAHHDNLCVQYAMQLEVMGQWTWAAFVVLHLEMRSSRRESIAALLARNVAHLDSGGEEGKRTDAEVFLVDTLKIPVEWIYAARAVQAGYGQDRYAEYSHLLRARQYGRAHEVAVCYLAPEGIVRHDFALILDLFMPLRKSAVAGGNVAHDDDDDDKQLPDADERRQQSNGDEIDVPGWQSGGQVFLDYIAICQSLPWLVSTHASSMVSALESELQEVQQLAGPGGRVAAGRPSMERVSSMLREALGPEAAEAAERIDRTARKIPRLMDRVVGLFDQGGMVGARGHPTTVTVARSQMVASLHSCVRSLRASHTLVRLAHFIPALDVDLLTSDRPTGDDSAAAAAAAIPFARAPPVEVESLQFMANAYCAALVEGSA